MVVGVVVECQGVILLQTPAFRANRLCGSVTCVFSTQFLCALIWRSTSLPQSTDCGAGGLILSISPCMQRSWHILSTCELNELRELIIAKMELEDFV